MSLASRPIRLPAVLLCAAAASLAAAPATSAQTYVCGGGPGPGEVQVGTTGGSHGIAAMPVCAAAGGSSAGGGGYAEPYFDPMADKMREAMAAFNTTTDAATALHDGINDIVNNPGLERYFDGGWEFYQTRKDAPPGEYCAAMFTRANSFMQLSGPGGANRGAMISFMSPEVPVTLDVKRVRVTLEQTGFSPQTVDAFNYTLPGVKFGAISLAIPTVQAAIDGFQDSATISVTLDGKKIASLAWTEGHAARDRLRACIDGR